MATATSSKTTGFKVPCPNCGTMEDGLSIKVDSLTLTCQSCGEDVTVRELNQMIADAQRLVRWLEMAREV